ncbi:MAG: hypothetical protein QMD46_08505 [Methanomicrobiales archaeon]|nr:hypothetical protein [Methanomicrobiales archaeon]
MSRSKAPATAIRSIADVPPPPTVVGVTFGCAAASWSATTQAALRTASPEAYSRIPVKASPSAVRIRLRASSSYAPPNVWITATEPII